MCANWCLTQHKGVEHAQVMNSVSIFTPEQVKTYLLPSLLH